MTVKLYSCLMLRPRLCLVTDWVKLGGGATDHGWQLSQSRVTLGAGGSEADLKTASKAISGTRRTVDT